MFSNVDLIVFTKSTALFYVWSSIRQDIVEISQVSHNFKMYDIYQLIWDIAIVYDFERYFSSWNGVGFEDFGYIYI